jgi:hypothetical protein
MKTNSVHLLDDGTEVNTKSIIQYESDGTHFGRFLRANKNYAWVLSAGKEVKIPLGSLELFLPEKKKEES